MLVPRLSGSAGSEAIRLAEALVGSPVEGAWVPQKGARFAPPVYFQTAEVGVRDLRQLRRWLTGLLASASVEHTRLAVLMVGHEDGVLDVQEAACVLLDAALATPVTDLRVLELHEDTAVTALRALQHHRFHLRSKAFHHGARGVTAARTIERGEASRRVAPVQARPDRWSLLVAHGSTLTFGSARALSRSWTACVGAVVELSRADEALRRGARAEPTTCVAVAGLVAGLRTEDRAFQDDVVLELDGQSAEVPWELLELHGEEEPWQPAREYAMVRRMSDGGAVPTRTRRPATGRGVVVAVDRDGAKAPAQLVARLAEPLRQQGFDVTGVGAGTLGELERALEGSVRVVILVAHGTVTTHGATFRWAGQELPPEYLVRGENAPDLVVLGACELGQWPGQHHSFVNALLRSGVRCVISSPSPVWAHAVGLFLDALVGALVTGLPFGHAVRAARCVADGGACEYGTAFLFQAWGDPVWTLSEAFPAPLPVSPSELIDHYLDAVAQAHVDPKPLVRKRLEALDALLGLPGLATPDALAAAAGAWRELEEYDRAAALLERALQEPGHADQHAELLLRRARALAERRREEDPRGGLADGDVTAALEQAEEAIRRTLALGRTRERVSLLGALRKEQAVAAPPGEARARLLLDARAAYVEAAGSQPDAYRATNLASLDLALAGTRVDPGRLSALRRAVDADREAAPSDPWARVGVLDVAVLEDVSLGEARGVLPALCEVVGLAPREIASVRRQVQWLALVLPSHHPGQAVLQQVLAGLPHPEVPS